MVSSDTQRSAVEEFQNVLCQYPEIYVWLSYKEKANFKGLLNDINPHGICNFPSFQQLSRSLDTHEKGLHFLCHTRSLHHDGVLQLKFDLRDWDMIFNDITEGVSICRWLASLTEMVTVPLPVYVDMCIYLHQSHANDK